MVQHKSERHVRLRTARYRGRLPSQDRGNQSAAGKRPTSVAESGQKFSFARLLRAAGVTARSDEMLTGDSLSTMSELWADARACCGDRRTYLDSGLLRFFFETSGSAGRAIASSASLAFLSARRRSMFLRIAAALCSTSTIARAPSSWASLCRLARPTLTGDGSADFLLAIFSGSRPSGEQTRSILRSSGHIAISVHP